MRLTISDTVKHLLIINVIMFIGMMTVGSNGDLFNQWFALYTPIDNDFKLWQIFTHMFMHSNVQFGHILFNMFALWMFGTPVEQRLGSRKFLFIYISSGLGAVLLTFIVFYFQVYQEYNALMSLGLTEDIVSQIINFDITNGNVFDRQILLDKMNTLFAENRLDGSLVTTEAFYNFYYVNAKTNVAMVGASGCLMGILAAFGMMNPNAELMLIFLPIPIKAKYFIPGIILLDLISALTGQSFFSPSNTAYAAHIGGAITGFLIMWYWKKKEYDKFRWN